MMAVMQHSTRVKAFYDLILHLNGRECAALQAYCSSLVPFVVFSIASYLNFDHGFCLNKQHETNAPSEKFYDRKVNERSMCEK